MPGEENHREDKMRGLLTVAIAASLSLPAAAATKYESWQGTWHLNKKETVYPKGVHVTANDMVVTKDDGDTLVYTETVVNDGKTDVQKYDGAYDGRYYNMSNGESLSFTHIGTNAYRAVRHDDKGFVRENSICEIRNGGKKLVCHAWAQHAPGTPEVAFDEIFDKAE
jgi:hypothetical protein